MEEITREGKGGDTMVGDDNFGVNFYGSEKLPDSTQLVAQFQKIVDNRFARWIMTRMTSQKKFEHILGVFAGVEEPLTLRESAQARIIEAALKRGMKTFNISNMDLIRNALKERFVRKGVALTLRSVAKYGITKPQIFDAPLMIVWNTTKQCNLHCKHCYANAGSKNEDELTLEQKLKVIDILDEAGVTMLAFSGGEPLISKDFWAIAKYASDKGMYTTIATNGTLLTKSVVDRLAEVGIKYVEISLDSPDPATHNEFRGQPLAWERTVQGIKNVVAKGVFDNAIATTATKYNYKQMGDMLDLAIQLKVKRFIVFNFVPTGRGKEIINEDLTPKEREELLTFLYDKWQQKLGTDIYSTSPEYSRIGINKVLEGTGKTYAPTHFATMETGYNGIAMAEFIGGCGAGRMYAALEDNGDLEPCVFLPIRVGNILKQDFHEIWTGSKVLQDLRNRDAIEGVCGTCPFRYSCGGCRARAYGYYGDYMKSDPGCILNESAFEEILLKLDLEEAGAKNESVAALPTN
jgi:radical SAM protein with 4Fe4S-binding SPASM domain